MSRTRGNGEGSIYQRKGRKGWFAAVSQNGRRKIIHAATRAEVDALLSAEKVKRDHGMLSTAPSQTLEVFLGQWLSEVVKPRVRPWTYKGYEVLVRVHIQPRLGKTRLDRLTPAQVQALMNAKLEAGLSPKTVQYMRGVLRTALGQALKWGLVHRNVADLVDGPKVERHEIQPFGPAEARTLLAAVAGDRLEALYSVALASGLRQGEALGLRWQDVDLDEGLLHVRFQLQRHDGQLRLVPLKTARSRRTVAIPDSIVEGLREHRQRQRKERLAAGQRWKGAEPLDPACHVFTTPIGTPLDARNVVRLYKAVLVKAGLPERRFHDLRHSCATLLLVQGVPMRVVMEILGHSQITLTANTYSHVLPEMQRAAAERMDAILHG
jgi:integrase